MNERRGHVSVLAAVLAVCLSFFVGVAGAGSLDVNEIDVIDSLAVDPGPYFLAVSPDGERLYISHSDANTPVAGGTVSVLDVPSKTVVATIPVGPGYPCEIAVTPDGTRVYLAISKLAGTQGSNAPDRVAVIDTATNTVLATIYTQSGTFGIALSADGKWAYVTNRFANRVSIIDTTSNTVARDLWLPGARGPAGLAITPDGGRVYIVNRGSRNVSVINTATRTVVATIPLSIGSLESHTAIAFTPDGTRGYITFSYESRVAVIDTDPASATYNTQIAVVPTSGTSHSSIVTTNDGALALVTDAGTGSLLLVDIDGSSPTYHTERKALTLGASPVGIALSKLPGSLAYAAVHGDSWLAVIGNSNHAPSADAGADQAVEVASCYGATVVLDGTGSSDPDGDLLTYTWSENGSVIAAGADPSVTLSVGSHVVTLTVDDGKGGTAVDDVVITVADTTAPQFAVAVSPDVLWPPNHQYVLVTPSFTISDACAAAVQVERLSVSSNEPDNGLGDGDRANDIVINDDGTLLLRAERSGKGSGRVYTITFLAMDGAGNSTTASATVTVPHGSCRDGKKKHDRDDEREKESKKERHHKHKKKKRD